MARSRRRNRRSTSQNAASLLALALPAPLQRVANSQVGPLLMFFGVPALLVIGLLQVDWQNGTPHLSVNPQKATEIRQAVKGQLGNLENQPVFQQLEQTARNVWNGQFPNNSQSYPPQPQVNPQQQPTPPVYSTDPYAPQQQYSQQSYPQQQYSQQPYPQQSYAQQPYPPSQRAQQQTWPQPNHGSYPQGSTQWSPSNGNSNPMATNRSTVGTARAPFPSTNPPAGQYVSATAGANRSPYSQADSQARQPAVGQQQFNQQQNQQQLSQQQLYQQQLYQQQLYQQRLREQQQYPQVGEWPAQTPWQSR